ncbi:PA0069 family radical SAM protein [Magnetospirillum sp. XM-1]|uniref:PA0069 family radical SAM protein n=1 Tax=Magnetospirillum sp. XM-1 TaxID=1663591 RepID=UPI00083825E4|nr:PA0069 family radical SAM protein [Magnetospirillum sp. XM-1]
MASQDWPKARGARSNPTPRFDCLSAEAVDDGWDLVEEERPAPGTTIHVERARSILTRNDSPDIPFDRSVNPYRGCGHGCVYCFARPSHAYLDLSPGLDFETRLTVKPDAAVLLEAALRKPGYRPAPIAFGTNTDPYQPIERDWQIMRGCLEMLATFHHPVMITTKGFLVTRDVDILGPMAAKGLAAVAVSVTTLDARLHGKLEPRASSPARRLEAIRRLSAEGVPTMVMAAPMIPRINDHELEDILAAASDAGATAAGFTLLRLPYEVKDLFAEWLDAHFPERAAHVLSLMAQQRGGRLNDPRFGKRMSGEGEHARLLANRFHVAVRKLGLTGGRVTLDCSRFKPPPRVGDQLRLF